MQCLVLASGNIEKDFPKNLLHGKCLIGVLKTSQGRQAVDVPLGNF